MATAAMGLEGQNVPEDRKKISPRFPCAPEPETPCPHRRAVAIVACPAAHGIDEVSAAQDKGQGAQPCATDTSPMPWAAGQDRMVTARRHGGCGHLQHHGTFVCTRERQPHTALCRLALPHIPPFIHMSQLPHFRLNHRTSHAPFFFFSAEVAGSCG